MDNKGFTMVELLVAMAIMGLLIIMAFPTISAIQTNNTNKKYEEYGKSVISAAKLYVDSYGVDIFDPTKSSQKYQLNFDDLVKKDLIKDINISDSTCITGKSNVWIVKYNDDYSYCLHMSCKIKGTDDSSPPIYESIDKVGSCKEIANKVKTVKYIYNDGTNNNEYLDEVIEGDDNYRIVSASRTGFNFNANHDVFLKWVDESGREYNANTIYDKKATGSTVFTAKTRKWEYYLYFIKNSDGTYGGSMASSQKCSYGSSCKLTANGFTREGYTFKHWKNGSSSDTYTNEEDVKTKIENKIPRDGARYDLTAIFRKNRINITYHANGGSLASNHGAGISINSSSNKVFLNTSELTHNVEYGGSIGTDGLINWNNASYFNTIRTGYSVKSGEEWNTQANGGGTTFNHTKNYSASELCSNINNSDCNIVMYVKWVPRYTLTFDKDGGSGTCDNITKFTGEQWGSLCTPSKTGYTFGGWYTEKNGGGTQITSTNTAASNTTVYAKWIINKYTVTLSSGTCISGVKINNKNSNTETFNYGTKINISSTASDYCQFSTWSDNNTSNSREITVNGNINLTANGRYNVVYTDFYSNGGYLIPREEQVCPVIAGCTKNSNCHNTTDLPGCRNKSGLVYSGGGLRSFDTSWATKGLRDFKEDNLATLLMRKTGCTSGSGNWHVSPGGDKNYLIPEEKPWKTAKELIDYLGEPYTTQFLTQDIRLNLYAGWSGCN